MSRRPAIDAATVPDPGICADNRADRFRHGHAANCRDHLGITGFPGRDVVAPFVSNGTTAAAAAAVRGWL